MNNLIFQLHTPEEFRLLSSQGHWIIGYIFLAVSITVLLQSIGYFKTKTYLWPLLITISGLILIPFSMMHHGISELPLVWKVIQLDPQQRQHMIMFILLFISGVTELLLSRKKIRRKFWHFVWPGVLLIIGYLFLTHPQHGTAEAQAYTTPFHTTLGIVLLITGALKAAEAIWSQKYKWIAYVWIIFLFIASVMLISYNEPVGAYQRDSTTQEQSQNPMQMKH